jgi:CheY-like chemotaxis protein/two-component sensor histidine kinase
MRLVDDLLDIARITRGKITLDRQRIDMRDVVARAIELASPALEKQNHQLQVDVSQSAEPVVDGDEGRLVQVVANLLVNAAKYTEPFGHVNVRVQKEGERIVLSVQDNGMGLDAKLLPRVFDLFVQGGRSFDRSGGGLGIGLSLVRTLVHMHGGEVEARSPGPGKGSTFTVRLPAANAVAAVAPSDSSHLPFRRAHTPHRVLVVDDNPDALELLADVLRTVGHEVRTAADPAQALEIARVFRPDVGVLDLGLPVMDGYTLAKQLRRELPGQPRLIALTGYGQQHDRERSREAGFDAHLVKPVDVPRLLDCVEATGVEPDDDALSA